MRYFLHQSRTPLRFASLALVLMFAFGLAGSTIRTPSVQAQGITSPAIVNITVDNISNTTAYIHWDVNNMTSCGYVNYGIVSGVLDQQRTQDVPCSVSGGTATTGGHTVKLTLLAVGRRYFYQIVAVPGCTGSCISSSSTELNFSTTSSAPLNLTNINVLSIGPTSATITWSTNKNASGRVEYGLTSAYELPPAIQGTPDSLGHSLPLIGLAPGTTYHYRLVSTAGAETAQTTTDRTFPTSSGGGGSLPIITLGPRASANDTTATISFSTNVPTASLVEYQQTPGPAQPLNAKSCNDAANCTGANPPNTSGILALNHTVQLTGLTLASSSYEYKITVKDADGHPFSPLNFTFNTSGGSGDRVFTTGTCNDGTEIGHCTAPPDNLYCRPGGGDPVADCRPDSPCPKSCAAGQTCQQTGDCTVDNALSGSPTECNKKECYQHCDQNSGSRSNQSCTSDLDCDDHAGNAGRCVVGKFNTPAVAGCFSTWPSCDANIIMKVRPDRVCEKWLTCKSSQPFPDSSGKTENQCYNLSICNSMSPNGQCNNFLEGGQCDNDALRFCRSNADCEGGGTCKIGADGPVAVTYKTPQDVSKLANLTGYIGAGLDTGGDQIIPGRYPYSYSQQLGKRVVIPDADFEEIKYLGQCKIPIPGPTQECTDDVTCNPNLTTGNVCVFSAHTDTVVRQNWEAFALVGHCQTAVAGKPTCTDIFECRTALLPTNTCVFSSAATTTVSSVATVKAVFDGAGNTKNNFLTVTPLGQSGSGARLTNAARFQTQDSLKYVLEVRMRSKQDLQKIKVALLNGANVEKVFGTVELSTGWETYRMGPVSGPGGLTKLTFATVVTGDAVSFDIDDVNILPALEVGRASYLTQSCRIYPGEDSPKCDYIDANSVTFEGLKGFCLERDPLNSAICVSWWPVDILSGENIFSKDATAGYNGRRPVYACVENLGLARKTQVQNCDPINAYCYGTDFGYAYGSAFTTYVVGFIPTAVTDAIYDCNGVHCNEVSTNYVQLVGNLTANHNLNAANPEYLLPKSAIDSIEWDGVAPDSDNNGCSDFEWPDHMLWSAAEINAPGGTTKNYCGTTYHATTFSSGTNTVWEMLPTTFTAQAVATFFTFDQNGQLTSMQFDGGDYSGNNTEGTGYNIIYHATEVCTKLAEVVTPAQDSAWVDRTSSLSTYVVDGLNYHQITDYEPYGGAVLPVTSPTPGQLPVGYQLSSMGADTNLTEPYQVRAGSVYACNGNCSTRRCDNNSGTKTSNYCITADDCRDSTSTGQCIGGGVCAIFNGSLNTYKVISSTPACTSNANCTGVDEECIGGAASSKGSQVLNNASTYSNAQYAQYQLQRLFAQAYTIWEWDKSTQQYRDMTNTAGNVPWQPPTKLCKVCAGTSQACSAAPSCLLLLSLSCNLADRHPTSNANQTFDSGADYCAIQPRVTNLGGENPAAQRAEVGTRYFLKFNAHVDREQLPIRRITIDWGDGSDKTDDPGISVAPKEDPANPFVYDHSFALNCGQRTCPYNVKVQIEDSWGWCSDGSHSPCNTNPNDWGPGITVNVE